MVNVIFSIILLGVLGIAAGYIVKAKKSGQKCVGCPYSKTCSAQAKAACANRQE